MQVRVHDKKDNMIFAHVLQAGMHENAEYDVVYDDNNKTLHIYDDRKNLGTSILNNYGIKGEVLEALGEADNWFQSILNKVQKKPTNNKIRFFFYVMDMVREVKDEEPHARVEDESLLYKPFHDKVKEYIEQGGAI